MPSQIALEAELRANRAIAGTSGKPVAGGAGSITTSAVDQVVSLIGGYLYLLQAVTADVYIAVGAAGEAAGAGAVATNAANRLRLRSTAVAPFAVTAPPGGATLHVVQVSGAGALEYTQMDDVG